MIAAGDRKSGAVPLRHVARSHSPRFVRHAYVRSRGPGVRLHLQPPSMVTARSATFEQTCQILKYLFLRSCIQNRAVHKRDQAAEESKALPNQRLCITTTTSSLPLPMQSSAPKAAANVPAAGIAGKGGKSTFVLMDRKEDTKDEPRSRSSAIPDGQRDASYLPYCMIPPYYLSTYHHRQILGPVS